MNLMTRPDLVAQVREEVVAAGVVGGRDGDGLEPKPSLSYKDWALPFTTGVLRESLRLTPPAGGGFRIARKGIKVAGFDVAEGVVVTADPRIGVMYICVARVDMLQPSLVK